MGLGAMENYAPQFPRTERSYRMGHIHLVVKGFMRILKGTLFLFHELRDAPKIFSGYYDTDGRGDKSPRLF